MLSARMTTKNVPSFPLLVIEVTCTAAPEVLNARNKVRTYNVRRKALRTCSKAREKHEDIEPFENTAVEHGKLDVDYNAPLRYFFDVDNR